MKQTLKIINIIIFTICVSAVFFLNDIKAQSFKRQIPQKINKKYAEGEILVKYKNSINVSRQNAIIKSMGDKKIKKLSSSKFIHVKLQTGLNVKEAIKKYEKNPMVEYAQPNYIYHLNAIPNDPEYKELWGLKNTGQTISDPSYTNRQGEFINNPGIFGKDMNFERAWDELTDCSAVTVAVIDTGVNYTHEDLAANMWDGSSYGLPNHGYDFYDRDNDPMDLDGHGTHVSGTIGAVGNNNLGITGACWDVKIMALKVFGNQGEGSLTTQIMDAIRFAADKGANVMNMSLGIEGEIDMALSDSIQYAADRDVVIVVSAGNGGYDGIGDDNDSLEGGDKNLKTDYYPCNFTHKNLLCVAALDQNYNLTYFSNYGKTSVDTAAPGSNVRSSYFGESVSEYDAFLDGWNQWSNESGEENNWSVGLYNQNGYMIRYLRFPHNYDGFNVQYGNNRDAYIYKNLGTYSKDSDALIINFLTKFDLDASSNDFVSLNYINADEHPFGDNGKVLGYYYGSSDQWTQGKYPLYASLDLSEQCAGKEDCTFGFRFSSDSQNTSKGMAIYMFVVTQKFIGNEYKCADGTSMSAPHVTGLAALIKAFNPEYTAVDIADSVNNGGDSIPALEDKIKSGKAADAWGSLTYINKPKNVNISIDPE